MTWRRKIWNVLEPARDAPLRARLFVWVIMAMIATSSVIIILESLPQFYSRYHTILFRLEALFVAVFSVEYVLRLWSCPERRPALARWRYALTPMALVDLVAIAPFYLLLLMPDSVENLAFLRLLRLMRIFKFTHYWRSSNMLLEVVLRALPNFAISLFMMMLVMLLAACGLYILEHKAQPESFGTIPAAMWWAIVSLTTVGYGDVVPTTAWGKILGSVVIIAGIAFVALPTSILAASFTDFLRRRSVLEQELRRALADHKLTPQEIAHLEETSQSLDLPPEDLRTALDDAARQIKEKSGAAPETPAPELPTCPHCGRYLPPAIETPVPPKPQ